MQDVQNTQNPDVNSFDPDYDSGASEGIEQNERNEKHKKQMAAAADRSVCNLHQPGAELSYAEL